jgi:hypothetical protein
LTAVLGFVCLPAAHSTALGACRYLCGTTIHETNAGATCCSQTFTCPNGQMVHAYGVYTVRGWQFCSPAF